MSTSIINNETVHRRLEALEAAISYTIASVSLHIPEVKGEVVDALKRDANDNVNLKSAHDALLTMANCIDRFEVRPKS